MNELKKLQAEEMVEGLNNYYFSSSFNHVKRLYGEGIHKYDGLKAFLLLKLGYAEYWVTHSHDAYYYEFTVTVLSDLTDIDFYHAYRWYMLNTYK